LRISKFKTWPRAGLLTLLTIVIGWSVPAAIKAGDPSQDQYTVVSSSDDRNALLPGPNPVWVAALQGDRDQLLNLLDGRPELVNRLDHEGFAPLHRAAISGRVNEAELLLEQGASVEARQAEYHGRPLQYAAAAGHEQVLRLLLRHEAEVDSADRLGRTPLIWAAMKGQPRAAEILLAAGADPNARSTSSWTALHFAAKEGHEYLVRLLLKQGADPATQTSLGMTAAELAPHFGGLLNWFRPAPFPSIGDPEVDATDQLYVLLASHGPAQAELDASPTQISVLQHLHAWTFEDLRELSPQRHEVRQRVWAKARRRAVDLLDEHQRTRLDQLVIQQRRHRVFLHPALLPPLELTDEQHSEIKALWREQAEFEGNARARQASYRGFWYELFDILSSEQRARYEELRGPAVR